MSCLARNTKSDLCLLRSRIRELHPAPRASLEALLRHLLRVASHSYKNAMTVDVLATCFCYPVLHGSKVMEGPVNAKVRCDNLLSFPADSPKETGYEGTHPKCACPV